MRAVTLFILVWAVVISACAPKNGRGHRISGLQGTTGGSDASGQEYVTNGDKRMEDALEQPDPEPELPEEKPEPKAAAADPKKAVPAKTEPAKTDAPKAPEPKKQTQIGASGMKASLKQFEISRFNKGDDNAVRDGHDNISIKLIFDGRPSIVFKGPLQGAQPKYTFKIVQSGHTLSGELTDVYNASQSLVQTEGTLQLTDHATRETARILYFAFKAQLNLREDADKKIASGSKLQQTIKDLGTDTFGWVNNWNVVRGASFYLVDIVKILQADQKATTQKAALSFKGASMRTGEDEYETEVVGQSPGEMKLVGNGEEEPVRMFSLRTQDPETKEDVTYMLDVAPDKEVRPVTRPSQQAQTTPETDEEPENPETEDTSTQRQAPSQPQTQTDQKQADQLQQAQVEQPISSKSFLRINNAQPRTKKMTEDFANNRNLSGVKHYIELYSRGNYRNSLQNFFTYSNPFRRVMEAVGQAFDVSPAYAYLTVVESPYFTGGHYKIIRPIYTKGPKKGQRMSSALGPFQLLLDTAAKKPVSMHVGNGEGADDERRFFVPSACGAAKYVRQLVDIFDERDSTVAILGYFQGQGGAAAAIYCSFSTEISNRKACAERINTNFSGKDYDRFLRLARNFKYSYAQMDRAAAIPKHMREYVNKKLAVYFIANDFQKYGFDVSRAANTIPDNGTISPARMKDSQCEDAVRAIKLPRSR